MTDEEFAEHIKTVHFGTRGRSEVVDPSPEQRIIGEGYTTLIPEGAAESKQHLQELTAKAKESMGDRRKKHPPKKYQIDGRTCEFERTS